MKRGAPSVPVARPAPAARPTARPDSARPFVLWAEDNAEDQILIRAALEDLPSAPTVRFANDGLALLEDLPAAKPRLVILDLKMPRLGGLETLRRIRQEPGWKDLPVSIFSAGNQPEENDACRALGALEVVQKPVDFRLFTSAVQRLVAPATARAQSGRHS